MITKKTAIKYAEKLKAYLERRCMTDAIDGKCRKYHTITDGESGDRDCDRCGYRAVTLQMFLNKEDTRSQSNDTNR